MTNRQQQNLSQSRDGGYTIIESLVAMIVVSVLMVAIAPVMAFSVATRVQARRMELATQAARAYIDALRTGAIQYGKEGFPIAAATNGLASTKPPTKAVIETYCVDNGGTCDTTSLDKDFRKAFRVQGAWLNKDVTASPPDPTSKGYQLLVRVYRADSFAADAPPLKDPDPNRLRQSIVGAGLGDRSVPVVEMTTEIPASGDPSYDSILNRLKKP